MVSREIAPTPTQQFDVFSAVTRLTRQLPIAEGSSSFHQAVISGAELQSGLVPHDLRVGFRGLDFRRADVTVTGDKPLNQNVAVHLFSRRPDEPNRIITLTTVDNNTDLLVQDNYLDRSGARNNQLKPFVSRQSVALYLAHQILRDAGEAQSYVTDRGNHALASVAGLLTTRATAKALSVSAYGDVRLGRQHAALRTQVITGFTVDDLFNQPTHVLYSATLNQKHRSYTPGLVQPVARSTTVEFSPTDNMRPLETHGDTESIRVELTAPAETDPDLLQAELDRATRRDSGRFLGLFVRASTSLDSRRPN